MKAHAKLLRDFFAGLTLLIGANVSADNFSTGSPIPGAYDSPGDALGRQETSTEGLAESIDPFSGHLHIETVDADMPGNGGLDLKAVHYYDGLQTAEGALSVGWDVNFGRILFPAAGGMCVQLTNGSDIPTTTSGDVVFQSPDGNRRVLYVVKDGAGNYLNYLYESADGWKGTCTYANGGVSAGFGLIVTSPDGTQYYMTERVGASDPQGLLTDHIRDRHGNTIQFSFNTTLEQFRVFVSRAQASDGRCLELDYAAYGSNHYLHSITPGCGAITTPSTTTYLDYTNYSGVGYLLTSATRPDGLKWTYKYYPSTSSAPNQLEYLTYPNGAQVYYQYKSVNFGYANPNLTVYEKTVSGTGLTTVNWTYTYTPGSTYDTTYVTGPTNCYVYHHESVKAAAADVTKIWEVGQILYKEIDAPSSGSCGAKLQAETYTWNKAAPPNNTTLKTQAQSLPGANPNAQVSYNVGPGYTIINGSPVGPDTSGIWTPQLASHVVTRYDSSGGTTSYTTAYTNYDDFSNPQTVTESGTEGTRTNTYTYHADTSLWVLHQIATQATSGIAGDISYTFYGNDDIHTASRYGVTTTYTYTSQGDVNTAENARGYTNTYSSYVCGIPQNTILEVSSTQNITEGKTVNGVCWVTAEKDGNGYSTIYTQDGLGRIKTITPPIHSATSITYNQNSTVATRGTYTETTTLDGLGRATNVNRSGISTTYHLDALGRRTFVSYTCAGANCATGVNYTLDALGRTTLRNNNGATRQFTYRSDGEVDVINERSYPLTYTYHAYGNPDERFLTALVTPTTTNGASYYANGLLHIVTQDSTSRTYGYNSNWFLNSSIDPETGTTTFGRDAVGNLGSITVGSAGTTTYGYDGQNRKTSASSNAPTSSTAGPIAAPDTAITYDGDNNVKTLNSGCVDITYNYDQLDEMYSEVHNDVCGGPDLTIGYGYDSLDHLSSMTYPSGKVVSYAPDVWGRPTEASGYVTNATYWPNGAVDTLSYTNGASVGQTLTSRQLIDTLTATAKGGGAFVNLNYGYDNANNVNSLVDSVTPANSLSGFSYDGDDQLTAVSGSFGNAGALYDGLGNVKTLNLGTGGNYSFGYGSNRMTSVSGSASYTVSYDKQGNATSDAGYQYLYDSDNRIVSVSLAAQGYVVRKGRKQ